MTIAVGCTFDTNIQHMISETKHTHIPLLIQKHKTIINFFTCSHMPNTADNFRLWKTLEDGTIVIYPDNSLIAANLVSQWLLPYLTLNNLYSMQVVKYKYKQFKIYSTDSANRNKTKQCKIETNNWTNSYPLCGMYLCKK